VDRLFVLPTAKPTLFPRRQTFRAKDDEGGSSLYYHIWKKEKKQEAERDIATHASVKKVMTCSR
jgi:hypothetical protein